MPDILDPIDGLPLPDLLRATDGGPMDATTDAAACRTDKIDFSKDKGCANDGFVEFCIPDGNDDLWMRLLRIAPKLSCQRGGGRARCNLMTEQLCLLPTRGAPMCIEGTSALSDQGWGTVCEIASLPQIRRIVHTIFE